MHGLRRETGGSFPGGISTHKMADPAVPFWICHFLFILPASPENFHNSGHNNFLQILVARKIYV